MISFLLKGYDHDQRALQSTFMAGSILSAASTLVRVHYADDSALFSAEQNVSREYFDLFDLLFRA